MKHSIKNRLLSWYIGSIFIIALYFWFGIHVYSIPYETEIFLVLLLILGLLGAYLINKIADSITRLTTSISRISSKNLTERITVRTNDEIEALAKSFNELLDRLEESFRRERQFIGDVAHELKTPIATLRSSIEIALSKKRSENEYRTILSEALIDINRLSTTLKDVLDLAWTEAQADKHFTKTIPLTELLEELSDIGSKLAVQKDVRVSTSLEKNVEVYGERDKLARAVLNIIDNGIKYNKKYGQLLIQLKRRDSQAVIVISDTGIGIPHKEIKQVFNRFYRGKNSSREKGLGLGLAIARSIIQIHHGDISVKSDDNKGTQFTIVLPVAG